MKTLIVADCVDWAITRLCTPMKKIGVDVAYHYIDTRKGTDIEEKNPVHLTIDLLKKYDQFHFTTARAVNSILRNQEALEAMKGKRIIMTIHTEREEDLQLITQDHWERIDQYISPTRYQQARIKELIGRDSIYIPHAIDEKKYSFTKDYPRKTNVVGCVGRIMPHKRLADVVRASEGYEVINIGYVDNEGHDYYEKFRDKITLYQNLTEDKKIEIMRNFTILVSISEPHIEVGPLPVLEAAALGIPILTTDVGWARDNLKHEKSAYFIGNDEDYNYSIGNLNKLIANIIKKPDYLERLRVHARQVIDNWTLDDYINTHKVIYEN